MSIMPEGSSVVVLTLVVVCLFVTGTGIDDVGLVVVVVVMVVGAVVVVVVVVVVICDGLPLISAVFLYVFLETEIKSNFL